METSISLAFAALIGFSHAFEADHLVAVSSMATRRDRLSLAIKDGLFWGLGHSSTLFLIGLLMIVGQMAIAESTFSYLEAVVGLMLIILGIFRIVRLQKGKHTMPVADDHSHDHRMAYGVGLVHGLAGSGVLMVMIMGQLNSTFSALLFILLFGLGSVAGMLIAAGVFSLPFSKKLSKIRSIQVGLAVLSALLCLILGGKILIDNLTA